LDQIIIYNAHSVVNEKMKKTLAKWINKTKTIFR